MKHLSVLLALCLLFSLLAGCTAKGSQTAETTATTEFRAADSAVLNGKKIIFIGNSYTYWGQAVIRKGHEILTQAERSNDQGYFYQLCKAKGIDVAVTNYTFGSHDLTDIFGTSCNAQRACQDENHPGYLTDPYFDYVAIQCYKEKEYGGSLSKHLQPVMDFFREANPNVKFLLLVPQQAYEKSYAWVTDLGSVQEDVLICNWGKMVQDISMGMAKVPGATQRYKRSTFVCAKDNHHQTLLAGYLTSLMVYCAITGESAAGQPYGFCDDSTIDPLFDLELFRATHYPNGEETNFVEVFRSETDMNGLQQLTDTYLKKYNGER